MNTKMTDRIERLASEIISGRSALTNHYKELEKNGYADIDPKLDGLDFLIRNLRDNNMRYLELTGSAFGE